MKSNRCPSSIRTPAFFAAGADDRRRRSNQRVERSPLREATETQGLRLSRKGFAPAVRAGGKTGPGRRVRAVSVCRNRFCKYQSDLTIPGTTSPGRPETSLYTKNTRANSRPVEPEIRMRATAQAWPATPTRTAASPTPSQRCLDGQERGFMVASTQVIADRLPDTVRQQYTSVVPEHRVSNR